VQLLEAFATGGCWFSGGGGGGVRANWRNDVTRARCLTGLIRCGTAAGCLARPMGDALGHHVTLPATRQADSDEAPPGCCVTSLLPTSYLCARVYHSAKLSSSSSPR